MIQVEIEGLDALTAQLQSLPRQVETKVLRNGLKECARYLRNVARSNAPKVTGMLRKNIRMVTPRQRRNGPVAIYVGFTKAAVADLTAHARKSGKKPFYWIFQEYGWTDRTGRRHAGKAFLRNSLLQHKAQVTNILTRYLRIFFGQLGR